MGRSIDRRGERKKRISEHSKCTAVRMRDCPDPLTDGRSGGTAGRAVGRNGGEAKCIYALVVTGSYEEIEGKKVGSRRAAGSQTVPREPSVCV